MSAWSLERGEKCGAPLIDGSTQTFEITMKVRAFWCDDLGDWILCRPMHLERLPKSARYIETVPPTKRDDER
jgi:hypothetical protein